MNNITNLVGNNAFKSQGERRIAEVLEQLNVKYQYEPGVLVNDRGYQRIWYPDFGLSEYSVYIEYFGMENDPVYDERTNHKMETYRENEIDIIPVYPYTLNGNYQEYIKLGIYCTVFDRLKRLEDKIGSAAVQPFRNTQYHVGRQSYR